MSVNSSDSSVHSKHCYVHASSSFIFTAFSVTNALLLPLFVFVLFVGFQRWRQRRSVPAAAAVTSHSDVFTYHVVTLELIAVLGTCFYCFGTFVHVRVLVTVGMELFAISSPGQTLFHLLTCVDRYLAVVHPVTYLGLKQAGGVRIRNVGVVCVWLLCLASLGLSALEGRAVIVACCYSVVSLIGMTFCSLAVLRVLIRPGPGEVGGQKERVDEAKRRAFHTITAIMAALLLRFVVVVVNSVVSSLAASLTACSVAMALSWLTLPGSLVLPLLFLHRAGKLPGCKHSAESG